MSLGEKQRAFVLMVGKLIIYTYEQGYEMSFGDAWAKTGHKNNSNHYIRLAIDLNLFKDGMYLDNGAEMEKGHRLLHDHWDTLGGAPRIAKDLNHYALEHNGAW